MPQSFALLRLERLGKGVEQPASAEGGWGSPAAMTASTSAFASSQGSLQYSAFSRGSVPGEWALTARSISQPLITLRMRRTPAKFLSSTQWARARDSHRSDATAIRRRRC